MLKYTPSLALVLAAAASTAEGPRLLSAPIEAYDCRANRAVVDVVWPLNGKTTYTIRTDARGTIVRITIRRSLLDKGVPDAIYESDAATLAHPGFQAYWLQYVDADPEVAKCREARLAARTQKGRQD